MSGCSQAPAAQAADTPVAGRRPGPSRTAAVRGGGTAGTRAPDGLPRRQGEVALADDGRRLCEAIAERLRNHAEAGPTPGPLLRQTVMECLHTMTRLHRALAQERGLGQRLGRELQRARAALSATREQLAGTQARERVASHLADHDSLTSLPNRRSFGARLDDALHAGEKPAQALAVLYLDLDGFKPINDRHGHDTGDELLRIVARRLRGAVRADDLVCRLGGDEFACLLTNALGREQIARLVSKLFNAVAAPVKVGALELSVLPSIGIAVCPSDGRTAATLLKRADSAMYRAKQRQLGYAFFDRRADA